LETPAFQTVARVGEVLEGQGQVFEVNGRIIALFLDEGKYYALDDACPHAGAPLSDGLVMDRTVTCTWHGWRFSLEDGRHLEGSRCRVATYPVRVEGDEIQVAVPA
jgi:nitrite reductase (NADH) small subunit/3-phenylpropionate/trans-cinnamate dioxygenase ferredoxin subunit